MITLREAGAGDLPFLWELHVASMREYVEATYGWDDADQRERFEAGFRPEGIQVIEAEGKPVGMWEVRRQADPWFLARIAIMPGHRNVGIGTSLIAKLLSDADSKDMQIALQVLKVNPAKALYERLGFTTSEETDTHFKMLRMPDSDVIPD